jgi:hypothetical protein
VFSGISDQGAANRDRRATHELDQWSITAPASVDAWPDPDPDPAPAPQPDPEPDAV